MTRKEVGLKIMNMKAGELLKIIDDEYLGFVVECIRNNEYTLKSYYNDDFVEEIVNVRIGNVLNGLDKEGVSYDNGTEVIPFTR